MSDNILNIRYEGLKPYNGMVHEFIAIGTKDETYYRLKHQVIGKEDDGSLNLISTTCWDIVYHIAIIVRIQIDYYFVKTYKEDYAITLDLPDSTHYSVAKAIKESYDSFCNALLEMIELFYGDDGNTITAKECATRIYNDSLQYLFLSDSTVTKPKGKIDYALYTRYNQNSNDRLAECFISETYSNGECEIDNYDYMVNSSEVIQDGYNQLLADINSSKANKYLSLKEPLALGFTSKERISNILSNNFKKGVGFYIEYSGILIIEASSLGDLVLLRLKGTPFKGNDTYLKSVTSSQDKNEVINKITEMLSEFNNLELDFIYEKILSKIEDCNNLKLS